MAERSTAARERGPSPAGRGDVRVPPLRPGRYDPADYADSVLRGAAEAGVSPLLVMTVLHVEAYKPHHPLLERLWQWWKPGASFGVANMHRATFERVRRTHGLPGRWQDLRDDPDFAIHAAALHLRDLDRRLPERHVRRYSRDELLALGYNTGERNMRAFARGVPPGPMARSYLRRFRAHRNRAAEVLADRGDPRETGDG
ncbi:lytic transglycosylase domain-containing protein [Streptomyces misionensis]|uniref:Lytic transglycosylase domain-containing protein n=1 Tax=Streptomyces misionensis TaxID=67331 RepID=A0A5C6JWR7_9ACTN|nr:lytic transglycosylase domain-containing protein [Streptomyces misionensis]